MSEKPDGRANNGGLNKGGRKLGSAEVATQEQKLALSEECRKYAAEILLEWMAMFRNKETSHMVKISIGNSIFDRGYGRPHQAVEISGHVDGEVKHSFSKFQDIVDLEVVEVVKSIEKK